MKRHIKISLINTCILLALSIPLIILSFEINTNKITNNDAKERVEAQKIFALIVGFVLVVFSILSLIGIFMPEKKC